MLRLFNPICALGFTGIRLPLENMLVTLQRLHSLAFCFETFAFRRKTSFLPLDGFPRATGYRLNEISLFKCPHFGFNRQITGLLHAVLPEILIFVVYIVNDIAMLRQKQKGPGKSRPMSNECVEVVMPIRKPYIGQGDEEEETLPGEDRRMRERSKLRVAPACFASGAYDASPSNRGFRDDTGNDITYRQPDWHQKKRPTWSVTALNPLFSLVSPAFEI